MSFSENVINIIDAIGERFGVAIDWTNQNMMPYLVQLTQRIIDYKINMSIFYIVVFVLMIIVGIKIYLKGKKLLNEDDELGIFPLLVGIAIIVVALVGIGIYTTDIITAITLPEKTIMEFIMEYK